MASTYELLYWGIPGRGEFIRLLLEYVGVPYTDVIHQPDGIKAVLAARTELTSGCTHFAPPILKVNDELSLSQTPVICAYLAKKHGLMPEGDKEYIAMQIDHTVHDVVVEVHATHHPVDVSVTYEEQKPEAKRAAEVVTKKRLPSLLGHLEECVKVHGKDQGPYLFGNTVCYVDLSIAYLLSGLEHAFPKTFDRIRVSIPRLAAIREDIMKTERIKSYLESDRRIPFGSGIFRQYPELDE